MNVRELSGKINKYVVGFSNSTIIRTISSGMARILPITIVASVAMILQSLPIDPYLNFVKSSGLDSLLSSVIMMTNNVISIYIVIALSSEMAKIYKKEPLNAVFISLIAFLIVTPTTILEIADKPLEILTLKNFGSRGIFVAMIVALLATRLYVWLMDVGMKIKMPKEVPPAISNSIEPLLITTTITGIFVILSGLVKLTGFGDIHNLIYTVLQKPLEGAGSSISALLMICLVAEGFWWFGIHGSNVTSAVIKTVYTPLAFANLEAVASGAQPQFILNEFFYNIYKGPRHLVLALMLLLLARSKHLKSIGKVSVVPGFFGISEPMKFGIPMIFNPTILIPMSLAPVICILIAYIASIMGFLSPVSVSIPWIMPPFISGFIANGVQGVIVQLIQFVAVFALYYPFFKMLDRQKVKEEEAISNES